MATGGATRASSGDMSRPDGSGRFSISREVSFSSRLGVGERENQHVDDNATAARSPGGAQRAKPSRAGTRGSKRKPQSESRDDRAFNTYHRLVAAKSGSGAGASAGPQQPAEPSPGAPEVPATHEEVCH